MAEYKIRYGAKGHPTDEKMINDQYDKGWELVSTVNWADTIIWIFKRRGPDGN